MSCDLQWFVPFTNAMYFPESYKSSYATVHSTQQESISILDTTSTSTLSLSNLANEQLQEIPTRTNSMVRAKKAKVISSSSSLTAVSSTRQTLIVRPSIAMTLPMEIICEIFNYLEEHPAHFTRGSLVCKTWYYSTQNHLYWKRLCELLKLPSPKPRAYKYKTYKSIVIKNWGSFCSLCLRKRRKYDPPIKPMLVDMDIADRIDFKKTIYCRYQKDKAIKRRRKKIKSSLAKCGIQLPTNDDICERLIDDGNIKGILHYLKLKLEEEKEELFKALLELERNG
ncbi:3819_t:CDS:2 [Entrophospora sp. SA101]|nr:6852_t:CDS:2 [Entrophospora sp. SA101]CAJ0631481.1 3819_t:CDS:2 [Entrophospora sp. SA101]